MIYWKRNNELIAATTLRNPNKKENNNMALHCGGILDDVLLNRTHLAQKFGLSLDQMTFANQTHSDHVYCVQADDQGKGARSVEDAILDCDALYTRETNHLIGVFTADCVPILLYDPIEKLICAIHSGWQGTVKQITSKTLRVLTEKEGCKAENIQAYIGPSIAFHSFEVGMEVVEKVKALPFDTSDYILYKNNGKALVDNQGLNMRMLEIAGVQSGAITLDKNDTFMNNPSFFSYRRDHACGRHLSFIIRKQ
ncbi:MAG: peptidoglycan editing factor PgeF [Erysipelotrichaceae bacterium]|nr:peptidoglycan editing factor PgeF [Erysipelotrichaceae bacterium]